jgi:hypothetical protein
MSEMQDNCPFCGSVKINPNEYLCNTSFCSRADSYTVGGHCHCNQKSKLRDEASALRAQLAERDEVIGEMFTLQKEMVEKTKDLKWYDDERTSHADECLVAIIRLIKKAIEAAALAEKGGEE